MTASCLLLTLIHKRHRYERYKELREYYYEQVGYVESTGYLLSLNSPRLLHPGPIFPIPVGLITDSLLSDRLRRSIIALHSAAADRHDSHYVDDKRSVLAETDR
jgi:hypothetical protein